MSAAAVTVTGPAPGATALPLVCDSPHSGTDYPPDFNHAIARAALRRCEDTDVDALWESIPAAGGTLVCAHFPRSYIDANRDESDIDVSMIEGEWPAAARPTQRCTALGNGLVWRKTPDLRDIYDRRLLVQEVQGRIEGYWRPYRTAVVEQLAHAAKRHGGCWHLNLHSMPSNAYERLGLGSRGPLADVVLGDRGGTTCAPQFLAAVKEGFEAEGLRVTVNDPYEGAALVRLAGNPVAQRHSLQVEINRALYMDEATRERSGGFGALKAAIDRVVARVAGFVAQEAQGLRALRNSARDTSTTP
jgi:N-formylglutamate deformylase